MTDGPGQASNFGAVQSPNGNPDTVTGWFDRTGYENGDECAYVYGATRGAAGQLYNQVILTRHYLTQEEFSNRDFFATGGRLPAERIGRRALGHGCQVRRPSFGCITIGRVPWQEIAGGEEAFPSALTERLRRTGLRTWRASPAAPRAAPNGPASSPAPRKSAAG